MPEYFVWLRPSLVQAIEAINEQDAAEAFLELPTTATPQPGFPPDCFVQLATGSNVPRLDGSAMRFWVVTEDEPLA